MSNRDKDVEDAVVEDPKAARDSQPATADETEVHDDTMHADEHRRSGGNGGWYAFSALVLLLAGATLFGAFGPTIAPYLPEPMRQSLNLQAPGQSEAEAEAAAARFATLEAEIEELRNAPPPAVAAAAGNGGGDSAALAKDVLSLTARVDKISGIELEKLADRDAELDSGEALGPLEERIAKLEASEGVTALEERIATLESGDGLGGLEERIAAVEAADGSAAIAPAMERLDNLSAEATALAQRLDGLASQIDQSSSRMDGFSANLETVQGRGQSLGTELTALAATATTLGTDLQNISATLTNVAASVDTLETDMTSVKERTAQLDVRLDGLDADLKALRSTVGEAEGKSREAIAEEGTAIKETVASEIGGLSTTLGAVDQRLAAVEEKVANPVAEQVMAISGLSRAVLAGGPFATELQAVQQLGASAETPVLGDLADDGLPSIVALQARFPGAIEAALKAEAAAPAEAGWLDKALAGAQGLVKTRPVGTVEGGSTEAILARAEAFLSRDDLNGAVAELQALNGAARDAMSPWLADAETRLAALSELNALEQSVLAQLGGRS